MCLSFVSLTGVRILVQIEKTFLKKVNFLTTTTTTKTKKRKEFYLLFALPD
tara:strand:- start:4143 stop:4295 length:153 start_codon:yes stop_codon:yes gene_type:complete